MAKPPRAATSRETELSVLDQSRRRCALCFQLRGDLAEKHGQIAHLDNDRANSDVDNLAFLCTEHHSLYDSRTSQHKNYTIYEAKAARAKLYQAVQEDRHVNGNPSPAVGREADQKNLQSLMNLMTDTLSIEFVRGQDFAGSFEWDRMRGIEAWLHQQGPECEFIDSELEALRANFQRLSRQLMSLLATNTFIVNQTGRQSIPEEWELHYPDRFNQAVKQLHSAADELVTAYDNLIRTARKRLQA